MCIRDRFQPDVQRSQLGELFIARVPCDLGRRVALEHAEQAVSYTHLRAHETVLDLVCRLLLEKKKTGN